MSVSAITDSPERVARGSSSVSGSAAVHYMSATVEWATPQEFFDRQNALHNFTLDPCSTHANAIVRRARASAVGLHQEPMTSLRLTNYEEPCIESLAMMLVSAWEEKYDLISVFSAAMSVIQEKAANAAGERPRT